MKLSPILIIAAVILLNACTTSTHRKERQIPVESKIRFEGVPNAKKPQYYNLLFVIDGEEKSVFWPSDAPKPETFSKQTLYRLEVFEEEHRLPVDGAPPMRIISEIARVQEGSKVLYDASLCEVHKTRMKRSAVPIIYGLPGFDDEFVKERAAKFPNSGLYFGGCVVGPGSETTAQAWVCPACAKEYQKRETKQAEK